MWDNTVHVIAPSRHPMPTKGIILNQRDFDTLTLLVDPHTPEQVRLRSAAFSKSFAKVQHVRRRLRELRQNGLVQNFPYFCVREKYYKLSRLGYQMLFPNRQLPHSRFFGPTSYGNQPHTLGVMQSLSLLERLFWLGGRRMEHITTEPYLRTAGNAKRIRPDADFSVTVDQKTLRYFFEYDRGTEPVDKGRLSDEVSRIFGILMLAYFQAEVLGRSDVHSKDRPPFFLYVDEFQSYVSDTFESMLSESRKYGLGLTIAHQYLSQLDDTSSG